MHQRDRKTTIKSGALLVAAVALLTVMILAGGTSPAAQYGEARSFSTLYVCSDGPTEVCDSDVMELSYRLVTRQPYFLAALELTPDETVDVVLQDLTIKFLERIDQTTVSGSNVFIHEDSDGNGLFDITEDNVIASATIKGKRAKFENMNLRFTIDEIPKKGLSFQTKFFISGGGVNDLLSNNRVDGLTVEAVNLLEGPANVMDEASFVDRSLFAEIDGMTKSRHEFLRSRPEFVARAGETDLLLPAGEYEFLETVVIPEGLRLAVEEGTIIELGADVSFLSYSPIELMGTEAQPIVIRPVDASRPFGAFAAIGRIGSQDEVVVNWVEVSGGSEARINGAYLSGMFSVYRFRSVTVSNSTFSDAQADDALNVKYSELTLSESSFLGNAADALDGDFVSGVITGNYFDANGNDALDFSGSEVVVEWNHVNSSGDKCVSVGEASSVTVVHNLLENCEIGVEVKDASHAEIFRNIVQDSRSWAVNAYVKKAFFGVPTFDIGENAFLSNGALFGGLAASVDPGESLTDGELDDLRGDIEWIQEILSTVPSR